MDQPAPCPARIPDDMGAAFSMGFLGGGLWHGVKSYRGAPKAARMRIVSGAVFIKAPQMGGAFAVWGGLFTTYDCLLNTLTRRHSPFHAVLAGAMTGATLACRSTLQQMGINAGIGGALLGLIEGLNYVMTSQARVGLSPEEEEKRRKEESDRRLDQWRVLRQERKHLYLHDEFVVKDHGDDYGAAEEEAGSWKTKLDSWLPERLKLDRKPRSIAPGQALPADAGIRDKVAYFVLGPKKDKPEADSVRQYQEDWMSEQEDTLYADDFGIGLRPSEDDLLDGDSW